VSYGLQREFEKRVKYISVLMQRIYLKDCLLNKQTQKT